MTVRPVVHAPHRPGIMDQMAPEASEIDRLRDEGYVVLPEVLSTDSVARIRAQLESHLQGEYPGRNEFEGLQSERVYALLEKLPRSPSWSATRAPWV